MCALAMLALAVSPAAAERARETRPGAAPVFDQVRIDDPAGDARGPAADVTSITATSYTDGTIRIAVTFSNRGSIRPGDQVVISFDFDKGAFISADARLEARNSAATTLYGKGRLCPPRRSCPDLFSRAVSATSGGGSYTVTLSAGDLRSATNSNLAAAWIGGYTTAIPADGTLGSPPYRRDYVDFVPFRFAPAPSPCFDYVIVDSRGSGSSGPSPPGAKFGASFAQNLPSKRMRFVRNGYAAAGGAFTLVGGKFRLPAGYHQSVVEGKQWLRSYVNQLLNDPRCTRTKLLLTGYSQGAQVTGDVYVEFVRAGRASRIIGVVLFGDPYFNSRDPAARGSRKTGRDGAIGTRALFPPAARGHVLSYCHDLDPVCQDGLAQVLAIRYGFSRHKNYHQLGEPEEAARWFTRFA